MNDEELIIKLSQMNIGSSKQAEILKNNNLKNQLKILLNKYNSNKLFYVLLSKKPKTITLSEDDLYTVGSCIQSGLIDHENLITAFFDYIKEKKTTDGLNDFLIKYKLNEEEITNVIKNIVTENMTKREASKILKNSNEIKYCNSSVINKILDMVLSANIDRNKKTENTTEIEKEVLDDGFGWLREGELTQIHTPETNPLNKKDILDEHLLRTGGKVITRFPPEPNGYLHIGHAKALNLSYNFSKMNGGDFILRFDDTNPKNEKNEFYKKIEEDIIWLLDSEKNENSSIFTKITNASDYFNRFIAFGYKLIEKNKAFVCNQSQEDMKFSREKNIESPYRNRSKEINKILFQEMIDGKWKEGSISLRLKQDMKSSNPLMHDLVAFRVIDSSKHPHCKTKDKYNVYPAYDFTHCINDSLEDITHSFCSREFFNRKETYYWVLNALDLYKPVQWEFSRLRITNVMLSKRKITELVDKKIVNGWDDPRLFTICGLRRRGFTSKGINEFVKNVGITFNTSLIELKLLENYVREDLNKISSRINCVIDYLHVKIVDIDENIINEIYIEKSDFEENGNDDFLRLTKTQSVGLLNYIRIKFIRKEKDCIFVVETNEKPKKFIHWVDKNKCSAIELRLYDSLFVNDVLNENSLIIRNGFCDPQIKSAKSGDRFQFRRIGFFCIDKDSDEKGIVVNLTLPLRNSTWK